jgi:hypothetical protein
MEIRGRYCIIGIGLRNEWRQITSVLENAGMSWDNIRECHPYLDALRQYTDHIKSCAYCRVSYHIDDVLAPSQSDLEYRVTPCNKAVSQKEG